MHQIVIYGAKSFARGAYEAVHVLFPECHCLGFVVNSLKNNPETLAGLPVMELNKFEEELLPADKMQIQVLIATPEDLHKEITDFLKVNGFYNYVCVDSKREAKLMERYHICQGRFLLLHTLPAGSVRARIHVYQAKCYKDKPLLSEYTAPDWVKPLQVGAALTRERITGFCDNEGDHISSKNANYCELTALYWIWKNRLLTGREDSYYGLFHYRRILDIQDDDILRLPENNVDAILPYPTLHEPDIGEHHKRYLKAADWEAMLQALSELQPEYASRYPEILAQPYFYNYNLVIAKRKVLEDYCAWLFPILERTEQLSDPKGWERADRYIGYMGENLMTLYFLYHRNDLHIVHTGRFMLT